MENKKKLLENIKKNTFCRLGVSKIQGVGVIAIKDIPFNTNPFQYTTRSCKKYNTIELSENMINQIQDKSLKKLINDFIKPNEGYYAIPENGFNSLDISFYLNHSEKNNLDIIQKENCEYDEFVTNRIIKKGEELTINYGDYE